MITTSISFDSPYEVREAIRVLGRLRMYGNFNCGVVNPDNPKVIQFALEDIRSILLALERAENDCNPLGTEGGYLNGLVEKLDKAANLAGAYV